MNNQQLKKWKVVKNSLNVNGQNFLSIIQSVGWDQKRTFAISELDKAIMKSAAHYSIWIDDKLIGFSRVLSDLYLFTTIPELLVQPNFQKEGIGTQIMEEIINDFGHTIIFLGAHSGKEGFYEKLGFRKGLQSYEYVPSTKT